MCNEVTYSTGYSSDRRFYRARTFTGYVFRVLLIVWIIRGYIDFFPRAILSYIFWGESTLREFVSSERTGLLPSLSPYSSAVVERSEVRLHPVSHPHTHRPPLLPGPTQAFPSPGVARAPGPLAQTPTVPRLPSGACARAGPVGRARGLRGASWAADALPASSRAGGAAVRGTRQQTVGIGPGELSGLRFWGSAWNQWGRKSKLQNG